MSVARTPKSPPAKAPKKTKAPAQPKKPARRRAPAQRKVNLHAQGARVLSIFGPFESRVMVELPAKLAAELFPKPALAQAGRSHTIDAVERQMASLRERAPDLADSALAAAALRLAYELEDPANSATSKSMCAKELRETMRVLRELAPPEVKKDGIDRVADQLAERRQQRDRDATAADSQGS